METIEMTKKNKMIQSVAWLGKFEKFHHIGEYSFVEYHPTVFDNCTPLIPEQYEPFTYFSAFLNDRGINRSYNSLDAALVGVIAYKYDGANTQADTYFMKAIKPDQDD